MWGGGRTAPSPIENRIKFFFIEKRDILSGGGIFIEMKKKVRIREKKRGKRQKRNKKREEKDKKYKKKK